MIKVHGIIKYIEVKYLLRGKKHTVSTLKVSFQKNMFYCQKHI